jgi:hypothetical protein
VEHRVLLDFHGLTAAVAAIRDAHANIVVGIDPSETHPGHQTLAPIEAGTGETVKQDSTAKRRKRE